jgi:hypothetical protein
MFIQLGLNFPHIYPTAALLVQELFGVPGDCSIPVRHQLSRGNPVRLDKQGATPFENFGGHHLHSR